MSDYLSGQLNRYKELLANLSRRNRELFYKESTSSSVNLSKLPFAATTFVDGKSSQFSPAKVADSKIGKLFIGDAELNLNEHFEIDKIKDAAAVRKFNSKIDKIRLSDDRHQREFGISGAWILGPFLCWRFNNQVPKDELVISPIFKVAVDLKKNKKKQLVLNAESDDISFNPTLILALKQLFGFTLPADLKFDTVDEALMFFKKELARLDKVVLDAAATVDRVPEMPPKFKAIRDVDGELIEMKPVILEEALTKQDLEIYETVTGQNFLLIDAVYIDQLNASRMVLIKDYEEIIEAGVNHSILSELFNGTTLAEESPADRSKLRELDSYRERENFFVVDIDSTQHRAIDKATKSSAIVIQGPPGSGKSQTIVNLIADYLAKGKKVLFVSEKRPALDVVFNRMKGANIESQAVLIHSSDLNKSDLYKSFLSLADSAPSEISEKEWNKVSDSLDQVKAEVHSYSTALIAIHPESGLQAADLIVAASQTDRKFFKPEIYPKFLSFDFEKVRKIRTDIDTIQSLLSTVNDFGSNPWRYRRPETVRTNTLAHKLSSIRDKFKAFVQEEEKLRELIEVAAGEPVIDEGNFNKISDAKKVPGNFAALWRKNQNELMQSLDLLTVSLNLSREKLNKNFPAYRSILPGTKFEMIEELATYYKSSRGVADWFSKKFWHYRKIRLEVCPKWNGTEAQFTGFLSYVENFGELKKLSSAYSSEVSLEEGDDKSSALWISSQLEQVAQIQRFLKSSQINNLPRKMLESAVDSIEGFNHTISGIESIKTYFEKLKENYLASAQLWKLTDEFLTHLPNIKNSGERLEFFQVLVDTLGCLEVIDKADMLTYKVGEKYSIPSLKTIINEDLSCISDNWGEVIETTLLNIWVDDVLSRTPELRSFTRDRIHSLIAEFKLVSEQHKVGSREAVHQAFAKRWIQGSNRSGVPLLKKESEKQRKVLSPREIMEKGALATMLQLKPCWLMSPLSISQMLPLQKNLFDVIIFDEASQVRVEDAIPSIYRAATMIVVGDNKQMPPTNFFAGGVADDEDEDFEIAPSVLDLASQVYPSVLLEWHYRSKAESLIAFSNRAFYGGKLIAAPNPRVLTAGGALQFRRLENTYFTSKEGNVTEAEKLVAHLVEMLRENSERSYGVIAMGQKQASAIDEAMNRLMESNAEARKLLESALSFKEGEADAGLFVKNLENVQGDERDVIILSVGYAPSAEGKKMRLNFGPLGKKGGGRRLNVAVTRAKSQMYVYCSFDPSIIPSDEEAFAKNPDACVFGRYLNYAKAISDDSLERAMGILNSFPIAGVITNRKSSRFALDVKRRLEANGHKVSAEIGSSGFYIDLGIHHPVIHSNFSLGVECDGAMFHSTPYARDRDKIRENLLRSRGWKIERIWSQDWSKDWQTEIIRIEKALLTSRVAPECVPEAAQDEGADKIKA
jgi:hypothetical protein